MNLSYFVSEDDFNETEVKIRKQNRYKTLTGTKAVKMAEQRDNSQFDRNHREWEHRSSKQKTFDRRIIS